MTEPADSATKDDFRQPVPPRDLGFQLASLRSPTMGVSDGFGGGPDMNYSEHPKHEPNRSMRRTMSERLAEYESEERAHLAASRVCALSS